MYEYRNVVRYKVYLKRSKAYTRERQRWCKHPLTHNVQPVHTSSTLHRCFFFLSPFLRRVHILKSASQHFYYYWAFEWKECYLYRFELSFIAMIASGACFFFPTVSKSILLFRLKTHDTHSSLIALEWRICTIGSISLRIVNVYMDGTEWCFDNVCWQLKFKRILTTSLS